MSADLTGIKPKNSYKSLMHVSDFSNGFTSSYQQVVDGDGTGCPLYININNVKLSSELILSEQSAPGTPDAGTGSVYVKSNGLIYFKNDAGTEYDLTATSALADLDYGDVLVSGTGTVMTVQTYNGGSAFGTMASATAADYTTTAGLSAVALSNNYNDLTNLPNITEISQDATNSLIQSGTGISWSYNDGANTLTPTVTLAPFTTDDLAEGSNLYYTTARFNSSFTAKSTSDLVEGSRLYYTDERVDDRVAALCVAGSNMTITYDDGAGTLTFASSGGGGSGTPGGSDTQVQFNDGGSFGGDAGLTFNKTTNDLTVTGALSASNVSGTNTGDQTSIVGITGTKAQFDTACTDGNFLYVGDITQYTDELAQDAVGGALANSTFISLAYNDGVPSFTASLSATGTPDNTKFLRGDNTWAIPSAGGLSDADYGDITVSSSGTVMTIDNDVVTYAKMQNASAQYILLGRSSAGAGDIQEVTTSADVYTPLGS